MPASQRRWARGARRHRLRAGAAAAAMAAGALAAGCGATARPAASGAPGTAAPGTAAGTPVPGAPAPRTPALRWAPCTAATGPAGLQCAWLTVPLDPLHPAAHPGTIRLALDRLPATGRPVGNLVVDPGGPGISGVDFLPSLAGALPAGIRSRFDVIGFDPPGVGRSDPVVCGTGAELDRWYGVDPAPTTAAGFDALVRADRAMAQGCERRSGRILPYVSTRDAAADLDRIRAALGDRALTYLGFSYGTLLGATYASGYPGRVRAMVLDGAIDPALGALPFTDQQAASLERELGDFFAACGAGRCGWSPGGPPLRAYEELLARVTAHPVAVGSRQVGPAALLYGTAAALYDPAQWPSLGAALSALEGGDGAPVLALFDGYVERSANGSYTNAIEAEDAVDCLDTPVPPLATLRADAAAASAAAPVFGVMELDGWATCDVWPVAATGRPGPLRAATRRPVVVVGSTGDPVTPLAWAGALTSQLGHAVLLTRRGDGHTGYFASACVRGIVDRDLVSLVPPRPGTVCGS